MGIVTIDDVLSWMADGAIAEGLIGEEHTREAICKESHATDADDVQAALYLCEADGHRHEAQRHFHEAYKFGVALATVKKMTAHKAVAGETSKESIPQAAGSMQGGAR